MFEYFDSTTYSSRDGRQRPTTACLSVCRCRAYVFVSLYRRQSSWSYCCGAGYQKSVAQFLTLCRASHLAEAQRLSSSLLSPSPAQRRATSRSSPAPVPHLPPSTNCEKLSGRGVPCTLPDGAR